MDTSSDDPLQMTKRSSYILTGAASKPGSRGVYGEEQGVNMELLYLLLPITGAFVLLFSVCCCGRKLKKMLHIPKEVIIGSYAATRLGADSDSDSSSCSDSDEDESPLQQSDGRAIEDRESGTVGDRRSYDDRQTEPVSQRRRHDTNGNEIEMLDWDNRNVVIQRHLDSDRIEIVSELRNQCRCHLKTQFPGEKKCMNGVPMSSLINQNETQNATIHSVCVQNITRQPLHHSNNHQHTHDNLPTAHLSTQLDNTTNCNVNQNNMNSCGHRLQQLSIGDLDDTNLQVHVSNTGQYKKAGKHKTGIINGTELQGREGVVMSVCDRKREEETQVVMSMCDSAGEGSEDSDSEATSPMLGGGDSVEDQTVPNDCGSDKYPTISNGRNKFATEDFSADDTHVGSLVDMSHHLLANSGDTCEDGADRTVAIQVTKSCPSLVER